MTKAEVTQIQRQLKEAGYYTGRIDSIYGKKTHDAYQAWLNANTPEAMPTPAPAAAKPWYLSRAIVGILVALVAVVVRNWGVEIDVEEATTLAVGIGGLVVALVGTIRRSAPIDPTLIAPGVRYPSTPTVSPERRHGGSVGPFGY